jgi:bifunctional UDP-N-acetylglucosamine pyrophosphorylase/glucosamine-1-phosphate N-acetyltransferase
MTRVIILAAGKGTRMKSELPKALVPLKDRPMIKYLMDSVVASGVDPKPLVVVSIDNHNIISRALKEYDIQYVIQAEQLGTGHAVACARGYFDEDVDNIIVLYGDHPFLTAESIKKFAAVNQEALTIMPTRLPDFSGWHQNFYHWGRIIRDAKGEVKRIAEFKDATQEEKEITEVNPGFMCFNNDWLFKNISRLSDDNTQKEYYLTDMVNIAFEQGHRVGTINLEPREAMGINSEEELKIAEGLLE